MRVMIVYEGDDHNPKHDAVDGYARAQLQAIHYAMEAWARMLAEQHQENEAMRKDLENLKENVAHLAATVAALQRSLNTMAAELRGWEARR